MTTSYVLIPLEPLFFFSLSRNTQNHLTIIEIGGVGASYL